MPIPSNQGAFRCAVISALVSAAFALASCGGSVGSTTAIQGGSGSSGPNLSTQAADKINTLDTVVQDMTMLHEALPKGVPNTWRGLDGPLVKLGSNPPGDTRFVIPWGAVYESQVGNSSTNTRVEVKDLQLFVLSKSTGKWKKLTASVRVKGEDKKGAASLPIADVRVEPSGGVSIRTGRNGSHYEFWSDQGRIAIDPSDIAGVFSTFKARLILDDPSKPDDRGVAQYIASAGADYWASAEGPAPGQDGFGRENDAGSGRFKYVVNEWRAFNMTTVPEARLRASPPPLNNYSVPVVENLNTGTGGTDASYVTDPATDPSTGTGTGTGTGGSGSAAEGVINSIDTIVGDMSLENDSRLDGIPNFLWATGPQPAAVLMGADPRGSKMQSWWLTLPNVLPEYKDADLWTAYVQWFLIFEGVGNGANNVRVEVRNPRTYYLSRSTGRWNVIGGFATGSTWFQAWKLDLTWANDNVDLRRLPDGSVAVRVPRGSPNVMHGIWPQGKIDLSSIVPDMEALFTTVQARLVVDNPALPDDRQSANLLMHAGADYYPTMTATSADSFPPAAGVSRAKRITNEWQAFNFATLDVARQDYQGATASISASRFRINPPPLE